MGCTQPSFKKKRFYRYLLDRDKHGWVHESVQCWMTHFPPLFIELRFSFSCCHICMDSVCRLKVTKQLGAFCDESVLFESRKQRLTFAGFMKQRSESVLCLVLGVTSILDKSKQGNRVRHTKAFKGMDGRCERRINVNVLLSTDVLVLLRVACHFSNANSVLNVFE